MVQKYKLNMSVMSSVWATRASWWDLGSNLAHLASLFGLGLAGLFQLIALLVLDLTRPLRSVTSAGDNLTQQGCRWNRKRQKVDLVRTSVSATALTGQTVMDYMWCHHGEISLWLCESSSASRNADVKKSKKKKKTLWFTQRYLLQSVVLVGGGRGGKAKSETRESSSSSRGQWRHMTPSPAPVLTSQRHVMSSTPLRSHLWQTFLKLQREPARGGLDAPPLRS